MGNTTPSKGSVHADDAGKCDLSNRQLDHMPKSAKAFGSVKNLDLSHNNLLVLKDKSLGILPRFLPGRLTHIFCHSRFIQKFGGAGSLT